MTVRLMVIRPLLFLCLPLLLIACSGKTFEPIETERVFPEIDPDSYYDSRFPVRNVSSYINDYFNSIKRIQSTVYYRTYWLDPAKMYVTTELEGSNLDSLAIDRTFSNQSTTGTALVIGRTSSRLAFLSVSHITDFPDTVYHYASREDLPPKTFVEAISVKHDQTNLIIGNEHLGSFDVAARDDRRDLALMIMHVDRGRFANLRATDIKFGNSDELTWADFVYALGYPKGNQMVTTGIISEPSTRRSTNFYIDSSFNRGFSGGVVLALRQGVPNFELVGMVTSASADYEFYLVPNYDTEDRFDPKIPYTDPIFVRREQTINYGITRAVTVNEIRRFLRENRSLLDGIPLEASITSTSN